MKFSKSIIIALTFFTFNVQAQSVSMMGGAPEGILFRGFENVIQLDDNLAESRVFKVEFVGGELKTIQANDGSVNNGRYILYPGSNTTAELIVRDNEGNEMSRTSYTISRLPDVDVCFATTDGKFDGKTTQLKVHSPAFTFLENLYEIQSWSIVVNGVNIANGFGKQLDQESLQKLVAVPAGTAFGVIIDLMGFDGIIRKKSITAFR
jgi:hypothetical protein